MEVDEKCNFKNNRSAIHPHKPTQKPTPNSSTQSKPNINRSHKKSNQLIKQHRSNKKRHRSLTDLENNIRPAKRINNNLHFLHKPKHPPKTFKFAWYTRKRHRWEKTDNQPWKRQRLNNQTYQTHKSKIRPPHQRPKHIIIRRRPGTPHPRKQLKPRKHTHTSRRKITDKHRTNSLQFRPTRIIRKKHPDHIPRRNFTTKKHKRRRRSNSVEFKSWKDKLK